MEYVRYEFEGETFWMELDEDHFSVRGMIARPDGSVLVSCRDDCLAEGQFYDTEETFREYAQSEYPLSRIAAEEFESLWERYTAPHRETWNAAKSEYPVGKSVAGVIRYFYPQGTVFSTGNIQGVADYEECRANSRTRDLYAGHVITGTVAGYDEVNMWVRIAGPCIGGRAQCNGADGPGQPEEARGFGWADVAWCVGWACIVFAWSGVFLYLPACLLLGVPPRDADTALFPFWIFLVQIATSRLILRRVVDKRSRGRETIGLVPAESFRQWADATRIFVVFLRATGQNLLNWLCRSARFP